MEKRSRLRLDGKVAIVSGAGVQAGAGVGNGKATAILFAREGARVVLVDAVREWAEGTQSAIQSEGGEAIVVQADVSAPEDCRRAVEASLAHHGALHILVNNVGVGSRGCVTDVSDEEWQRVVSVNLMGMVYMSRYAIPHMRASGGGAIVNISSVTALRPKRMAPYTVTKAAVVGLTHAMALDHAAERIRVNCIMPGLVYTPRVAQRATGEMRETRRTSTPLQIEGEPWDIGWAAVYLASDEARWVTGVVLPVDGGFLLTSAPN
ncbi:MAG: SDR family NAD(P)-dependent oxidoreductase [Chloroflexota bacterium]|nr:SDR family NAD(P)-dependent oxidoreductase [Chloroflexota bacterium]